MKNLYLIKCRPKPTHHNAPFHPVIICDLKRIADRKSQFSGDGATAWVKEGWDDNGSGWLIIRWQGLLIDYGHLVSGFELPDGTKAGFWRDYENKYSIKDLFAGAVFWSDKQLPLWLEKRGVIYPPDEFSQQRILDDVANDCSRGFRRDLPKHWRIKSFYKVEK